MQSLLTRFTVLVSAALVVTPASSVPQQTTKPTIASISGVPSEPMPTTGNCTSSTSGYLELHRRTELTEAEIGKFVRSSLQNGYVVTIYPRTKSGIFVNMECIAVSPTALKAP